MLRFPIFTVVVPVCVVAPKALNMLRILKPDHPQFATAKKAMADIYLKHRKDKKAYARCYKAIGRSAAPGPGIVRPERLTKLTRRHSKCCRLLVRGKRARLSCADEMNTFRATVVE